MNLQQALPPEAHGWASDIHVNPDLTRSDRIAFYCFFGFFAIMVTFLTINMLNRYLCENHGTKCLWCKKFWVGRGCNCISRYGTVGSPKKERTRGSEDWQKLSYAGKLYHSAKFTHREYLKARREGKKYLGWCYQARREAYLRALRYYMDDQAAKSTGA